MAIVAKPVYHELEEPGSLVNYTNAKLPTLDIGALKYRAKYASFKRIKFNGLVCFDGCDLSNGLLFDHCDFDEPLGFKNVKSSSYDLLLNPDSQNLIFKNCIFKDIVKFEGENTVIERAIYFENCTFTKGLLIESLKIELEDLTLKDCIVNENLDLFNISSKNGLTLDSNNIKCEIRIENFKTTGRISIIGKNEFGAHMLFRNSRIDDGVIFNDGLFKGEIRFTNICSITTGLVIIGSTFEKTFINKAGKSFSDFFLESTQFSNGIYINGKEDLLADDPTIKNIRINVSEIKGDVVFRYLNVGVLEIQGNNTSANLFFEHLSTNQIKIKAFNNNSGFILSGIRPSYTSWYEEKDSRILRENAVHIDTSNFGKAQFYRVNFVEFKKIIFDNNILTEISTSHVKWFTPDQLEKGHIKPALLNFKQRKQNKPKVVPDITRDILISSYRSAQEIYRQLKFASQKQGDSTQALEFHRYEMNYYRKIVTLKKPRNWSEYLILLTSLTNNYGQSWLKAFWLLIVFTFASYLPIGFLLSDKMDYTKFATSYSDIALSFNIIFENLRLWAVLLNPSHRIKDLNENIDKYPGIIYLWDILSRIVVSYFIFQVISSFRKFSK
jgi:hypothetical protein